jgi:hypothetical protein
LRKNLGTSYVQIAKILGNKDHSSIIYAHTQAKKLQKSDLEFAKDIKEIEMLGSLPNNYTTVGLDGKFPYPKNVKKIIDDIFIIVLPSFLIILENYNIKTSIGHHIGTIMTQLIKDNFIKEKTFIKVQTDLKRLKKLSILLSDKKLQTALDCLV